MQLLLSTDNQSQLSVDQTVIPCVQVVSEDTGSEGVSYGAEMDQLSRALQGFESEQANGQVTSEDQEGE